jgi:hypothetical protein
VVGESRCFRAMDICGRQSGPSMRTKVTGGPAKVIEWPMGAAERSQMVRVFAT